MSQSRQPQHPTGFRLSDGVTAAFKQLCRIRRAIDGSTQSDTLGALVTDALVIELDRNPDSAHVAADPVQSSKAVQSIPKARQRTTLDWF